MTQIQLNNDKVLLSGGAVATDPACCCDCPECDLLPAAVTVEFLADLNAYSPGTGCAGGCADWIAAFNLPQLTQAQVDYMVATWPSTWPQTQPPRTAGCYYGLFEDLPCGATSMVLQIVAGGRTGLAVATVTIGWADGVFVQITCTHEVSPAGGDCCANITRPNEGAAGVTVGMNAAVGVPCDFALVAEGYAADMILTANCGPTTRDFNPCDFNPSDFA
jgi:hypothetical protein